MRLVLCKKELSSRDSKEFLENKYYKVYLEFEDSVWIISEDGISLRNFKKGDIKSLSLNFKYYFYTGQELRKLKINKLYHINDESVL